MDNKNETIVDINDLEVTTEPLTDEQVHNIYDKLSEVDKASTEKLTTAEEETESSNYTTKDNNVIEAVEEIPGVNVTPSNIAETINENENDIKSVLSAYDLDDVSIMQMLKIIDEYKAGNQKSLYSRLPEKLQAMVNGIIMTETHGNINIKQLGPMRNSIAKMLVDDFINDAKISASVDEFNSEMASAINEMNTEYDSMLGDAIDTVFNKIEDIRTENPDRAEKIESVKSAFDNASTFEKQLEFAKRTSINKFNKLLTRYDDDVFYFNKTVNSNTIGVKINDIEEIAPIIKMALPQYTEDDIKKFIICICRTIDNIDDLAGIAYEYRMIASIYKYKFVPIDEKGEIIFENVSKVIDAILS